MLTINRVFKLSLAFNCGLVLVAFCGFNLVFGAALACLFFCFSIFVFKRKMSFKFFFGVIAFFVLGVCCFLMNDFNMRVRALKLDGENVKVHAKVTDVKAFSGAANSYILKIDEIDDEKFLFPIYASLSGKKFKFNYGDEFRAKMNFKSRKRVDSNFGFNFAKAHNIYLNGKILNLIDLTDGESFLVNFFNTRNSLVKAIDCAMSEPSNFLASSIFLGKSPKIPYGLQRSFDRCGLSHIFAVSGLHISILFAIMLYILRFLKMSNKMALLILCFFLLCYNVLLGFCVSAIRASLMNLAYLFGVVFKKKINSIYVLCLAATTILIVSPNSVFSCSFVLSFSSCLGILLFFKPISNFMKQKFLMFSGWQKYLIELFSLSVSAFVFSSVFLTLFFGRISIVAPFVNLMVMPFIPLVLVLSGLTAVSGYLGFLPVANFFGYFCEGVFNELVALVRVISNLPFCCLPMRYFFVPFVVIGLVGFLTFVFFYARFAFFSKTVAILCCLIVFVPTLNNVVIAKGASCVSVIGNGGFGFSVVINSSNKVIVLNCGGSSDCDRRLCNFLDSRGVKTIDFLIFLSNNTQCRNCNINTIVDCFKTFCVMMPYQIDNGHLVSELAEKGTHLIFAEQAHFDNFPVAIDFIKRPQNEGFNCFLSVGGISFAYCFSQKELLKMQEQRFANVVILDDEVSDVDYDDVDCGFLILLKPSECETKKIANVVNDDITEFVIHGSYLKQEGY